MLFLLSLAVGVGRSRSRTTVASSLPLVSGLARGESRPRSPSPAFGVGSIPSSTALCNSGLPLLSVLRLPWREHIVVDVGNAPPAIPAVTGANICCSNARPLCVIPCRGQLPENGVEAVGNNGSDVFQHDEAWSNHANDSHEIKEQPAPGALVDTGLAAGGADVLAGESSANNVS